MPARPSRKIRNDYVELSASLKACSSPSGVALGSISSDGEPDGAARDDVFDHLVMSGAMDVEGLFDGDIWKISLPSSRRSCSRSRSPYNMHRDDQLVWREDDQRGPPVSEELSVPAPPSSPSQTQVPDVADDALQRPCNVDVADDVKTSPIRGGWSAALDLSESESEALADAPSGAAAEDGSSGSSDSESLDSEPSSSAASSASSSSSKAGSSSSDVDDVLAGWGSGVARSVPPALAPAVAAPSPASAALAAEEPVPALPPATGRLSTALSAGNDAAAPPSPSVSRASSKESSRSRSGSPRPRISAGLGPLPRLPAPRWHPDTAWWAGPIYDYFSPMMRTFPRVPRRKVRMELRCVGTAGEVAGLNVPEASFFAIYVLRFLSSFDIS